MIRKNGFMITPVSALSGFSPDIVSTFSPTPGFSFEDSSWKKYATPALQVARLFSPGLDVALGVGAVIVEADHSASDASSDHSESHWGRNLLIFGGLFALALLAVRPGFGRFRKYELLTRESGGPVREVQGRSLSQRTLAKITAQEVLEDKGQIVESDVIYDHVMTYLHLMASDPSHRLQNIAAECLQGIREGRVTTFSQVLNILYPSQSL